MSQSPATFNTPHPMKKKVITALVAVLVGHLGVLWAVSHIKTMELKQNDKKPLNVRFIKIKEDVPPPPAKVEPIQPKVEPKPIEKKIEPKPIEKPKVISKKVEKVEKKVIHQDDTQEKLKKQQELEQQRLDQLKREQTLKDQQAREQMLKEQQAREQALKEQQAREQAARQNTPRKVSAGDVSWSRSPKISQERVKSFFKPEDGIKTINLEISSDGTGKVTNVKVVQSSGVPAFDDYVVKQTYAARFRAFKENGMAVPFSTYQRFDVSVDQKRR